MIRIAAWLGAVLAFGVAPAFATNPLTPLVFAGGSTDVGAVVDIDGDGPDATEDCFFKLEATEGLSGALAIVLVDENDMPCPEFPLQCRGSFQVAPSSSLLVRLDTCAADGILDPSIIIESLFFRPGDQPPGPQLLSWNTMQLAVVDRQSGDRQELGGGFLCDANGPVVMVEAFSLPSFLFDLRFFPDAVSPTHLLVPLGSNANFFDVYAPIASRKILATYQTDPTGPGIELDLDGLCECSRMGSCLAISGAPTMGEWGLIAMLLTLLLVGGWGLSRRPAFARAAACDSPGGPDRS